MSDDSFTIPSSELAELEAPRKSRRRRSESPLMDDLSAPHANELPQITGSDGLTPEERRLAKENEKVQSILGSNKNTGAKVVVSRKNRQTGRYAVLSTIPVDEYDEDQLSVEYGGGQYISRIRLPNSKLTDSWTWDVDPSVRAFSEPVVSSNGGMDIPRIIDAVRERNGSGESIRDVIETISDRNAQTFQMMMKQMQDSNAQMLTLITTMNRHSSIQPDTMMSGMMNTMLSAIMTQKSQGVDQIVDAFVKLREITGGDEGKSGGNEVMDTIIGMMTPLAAQLMGKLGNQTPAPQLPAPEAAPVPTAPVAKSNVSTPLQNIAGLIIRLAQKETDAVSAVNVVTDLLDDKQIDYIATFLAKDEWWTNLIILEDRVIPFKLWFEEVRKEFLDIHVNSEDDEDESETLTNNT